jgi:hypothetical protein
MGGSATAASSSSGTGTGGSGPAGWTDLGAKSALGYNNNAICPLSEQPSMTGANSWCDAVIDAWSGGAFDSKNNRLLLWGGGHNDYYGNEIYYLPVTGTGAGVLARLNDPGMPDNRANQNAVDAIANGTQPNSRHSYGGVVYVPSKDELFIVAGAEAALSSGAASDTWTFSFATATWTRRPDAPQGSDGAVTGYDPNTDSVFYQSNDALYQYDVATNTWSSALSNTPITDHQFAVVDPKDRLFIVMGANGEPGGGLLVSDINPAHNNYTLKQWTQTGCDAINNIAYPGLTWDSARNQLVGWTGTGNTVYVGAVDIAGQKISCTAVTHPNGPTVPGAANGLYGRFQYAPSLDLFVEINEYMADAFTLRL